MPRPVTFAAVSGSELPLPLRGLRVVDTTDAPSWSSARLLADLGADVVRVDRTGVPLDPLAATRHVNKRSIVCDGQELGALLAHADVWFDSGSSGLDPGVVREEHPQLVIVSSSPFGATGPYSSFVGTHAVVYALSGQLSLCRLAGRPPLLPPGQPAFEVAAAMGAYVALVAIWNRAVMGDGDHIDLSIHEAFVQTTDTMLAGASVRGDTRGTVAPGHPAFPTRDGLVRPLVVSHRQWTALREWVGDPPELHGNDDLEAYTGRLLHPDVMASIYAPLFADTTTEAISEEAQRRNVPATPVLAPRGPARQRTAAPPRHLRRHRRRGTTGEDAVGLLGLRRSPGRLPRARPRCRRRHRCRAERPRRRPVAVRRAALRRPASRPRGAAALGWGARPRVHPADGRARDRQAAPRPRRRRDPHREPRLPRPEPRLRRCRQHVVAVREHQPRQAELRRRPHDRRRPPSRARPGRRERHRDREPRARRARRSRTRPRGAARREPVGDPGEHAALRWLRSVE